MSETAEGASDPQVTFKVKMGSDGTHTVTMAETATVMDLKTKLATEEYENIPVERQRLIYSGRVMKNDDTLASYKVKAGNTIHLVKSAASNPAPPANPSAPTPQAVPSNMAAGTSANNLLAGLTGARFAGHAPLPNQSLFGPDGGMNLQSPDAMADMLSDPNVAQQMNEALNNPAFIDILLQSNPTLRDMPNAREMLNSPMFRSMMTNPDYIRMATRMRSQMEGGASSFPAPGATDTTPAGAPSSGNNNTGAAGQGQLPNPFANPFGFPGMMGPFPGAAGGAGAGGNPFAALFAPNPAAAPAAGAPASGTASATSPPTGDGQTGSTGANAAAPNPAANPFNLWGLPGPGAQAGAQPFGGMNMEQLQQMAQMMGLGGSGPAAPPDNRPPEEMYADQLRQLNDMGFYDFDRNVAALRRAGGSVQGAIQSLLGD